MFARLAISDIARTDHKKDYSLSLLKFVELTFLSHRIEVDAGQTNTKNDF